MGDCRRRDLYSAVTTVHRIGKVGSRQRAEGSVLSGVVLTAYCPLPTAYFFSDGQSIIGW